MSQPIRSRVCVDPSPPAPIVPSYLLVDRGGKRYRVELFEVDDQGTIVHDKLDEPGNWQETAMAVVDCLHALDGFQDPQGTVFDFNHFQTADMGIQYTPNHPEATVIPSFYWRFDQSRSVEARSIPRGSPQDVVVQNTLRRLGTALSAPPSRVEPVRYHADRTPYLSRLAFPAPRPEQDLSAQKFPRPSIKGGNPPYYPANHRWIEAGAGGDCGVYSLIDAEFQRGGLSYPNPEEWRAGLTFYQPVIRYGIVRAFFNFCKDDQFILSYFDHFILQDIEAQEKEEHLMSHTLSLSDRRIFTDLYSRDADTLTLEQKRWLAQAYAIYISGSGRDIDSTFFLAYALEMKQNVAIVTEQSDRTFKINQVFPPDVPDRILSRDNTLFIRSDPAGGHHQSVNYAHPELQAMIDAYNTRPPAGTV